MKKLLMAAVCAAGFTAATGASADITLTGSQLGGATLTVPGLGLGDTGSATYAAGQITLVIGNSKPGFSDTAQIYVPNNYLGVTLGTLSSLLSQGAAGHVSFDVVSSTNPFGVTNNFFPYWDVSLIDPGNSSNIVTWNAFSDNTLGANPFNQGDSTNASASSIGTFDFGPWSNITGTYGSWAVAGVTIDIGGWCSPTGANCGQVSTVIDSITLPGTLSVTAGVPEPFTLSLFGAGMAGVAALRRRKASRKA